MSSSRQTATAWKLLYLFSHTAAALVLRTELWLRKTMQQTRVSILDTGRIRAMHINFDMERGAELCWRGPEATEHM